MYATYGRTESGDDLPVLGWHRKPSGRLRIASCCLTNTQVGFVSWSVDKLTIMDKKK
jgi:hypothetical protein